MEKLFSLRSDPKLLIITTGTMVIVWVHVCSQSRSLTFKKPTILHITKKDTMGIRDIRGVTQSMIGPGLAKDFTLEVLETQLYRQNDCPGRACPCLLPF